jgi:hypothetical protein
MNLGAQGEVRDGPPNQFGGIYAKDAPANESGGVNPDAVAASAATGPGSGAATSKMSRISLDGLVPEGSGGEIASSVPAQIRARAQSAYKEAYTRAYRAYLGASPAAGDPTATPFSDGGVPPADQCFLPCNPPSWAKDRGPPPPEVVQIACCDQRCNNGVRICTSPDPNRPDLCCRDWWWIEVHDWSSSNCWYDTEHPCCDPQDPNSLCCTHPETGERCPFTCPRTVCHYEYSVIQHNTKVCADILPAHVRLPMTVSGDCWLCGAWSCSFCVSPPGGVWTNCPGGGSCNYGPDGEFSYSVKSDKPVPCATVVCTPDPCP